MLLEFFKEFIVWKNWKTIGSDVQYKLIDKTLYFQQSNSNSDWKYNFSFPAIPYKNMEELFFVHRGFKKLWKEIRDEINKLDFDTIVGYSHGGALATLAHEDYLFRKGVQPKTYVFGCPRILWFPFKGIRERFSNITYIKNPLDIVTKIPPAIFGYRRVYGELISLKGNSKKPLDTKLLLWITGHTPEDYIQRLENL